MYLLVRKLNNWFETTAVHVLTQLHLCKIKCCAVGENLSQITSRFVFDVSFQEFPPDKASLLLRLSLSKTISNSDSVVKKKINNSNLVRSITVFLLPQRHFNLKAFFKNYILPGWRGNLLKSDTSGERESAELLWLEIREINKTSRCVTSRPLSLQRSYIEIDHPCRTYFKFPNL